MNKVIVDLEKLNKDKIIMIEHNNSLKELLKKMEDTGLEYDDMLISKTGNLYKEKMHEFLKKEEGNVLFHSDDITKKMDMMMEKYRNITENIKEEINNL